MRDRKRGEAKGPKGRRSSRKDGDPEVEAPDRAVPADLDLPDPRATERAMSDISRLLGSRDFGSMEELNVFMASQIAGKRFEELNEGASPDALGRAQDLMYDAWDSGSSRERITLAKQALGISPDCADAYNLLAEETARSAKEALALFERGVEAGERVLGPETFEEDAGHFWGVLRTRPYMRAREGLATCLERLGRTEEAIEHYEEMLRLNPNDNQGVRDVLLNLLLERDHRKRAGALLDSYADDGSAQWLYSRALWTYREEGESEAANAALHEALEHNEHVPPYLLGDRRPPRRYPEYTGWGDEREAQAYAVRGVRPWKETRGARGWLLRTVQSRG